MADLRRPVVLVGLMGAGKTAVGRRLAARLGVAFVDADRAIEEAAGCTIADIFQRWGEAEFRRLEQAVIRRLLTEHPGILSTGGGAFIDAAIRAAIRAEGTSLWLRADLETLVSRTARRDHRPLLNQGNPRQILADLMTARYPIYAQADIVIDTAEVPVEETVEKALTALVACAAVPAEQAPN